MQYYTIGVIQTDCKLIIIIHNVESCRRLVRPLSYQKELRGCTERFGLISPRQCNLLTIRTANIVHNMYLPTHTQIHAHIHTHMHR